MHLVMISGSRNPQGQTARAADAILEGYSLAGGSVERHFVPALRIERCRQCDDSGLAICRTEGRCIIDDDLAMLMDRIRRRRRRPATPSTTRTSPRASARSPTGCAAWPPRGPRGDQGQARRGPLRGGGCGGGAPNCCVSLSGVASRIGLDVVDMIPARRQNLEAMLPPAARGPVARGRGTRRAAFVGGNPWSHSWMTTWYCKRRGVHAGSCRARGHGGGDPRRAHPGRRRRDGRGAARRRGRGSRRRRVLLGLADAHLHLGWYGLALSSVQAETPTWMRPSSGPPPAPPRPRPARGSPVAAGTTTPGAASSPRRRTSTASPPTTRSTSAPKRHAGWANTRALAVAGVSAVTPDPDGGRILRDAAGRPTGILLEEAMGLVADRVPEPTVEEMAAAVSRAATAAARAGLTGVHDMDDILTFRAEQILHAAGELPSARGQKSVPSGTSTRRRDGPPARVRR